MKVVLAASLIFQAVLVSSISQARPDANPVAVININMTTGRAQGVPKYDLIQQSGGIRVVIDPNTCGNPGPCTAMAVESEIVTPRVKGNAEVDGVTTILLTKKLSIIVTEKMNGDEAVMLEINSEGTTKFLPLKPLLKIGVQK